MCYNLSRFYHCWIHKQKWKHYSQLQIYLVSLTYLRQSYSKCVFQTDISWQIFVSNPQRSNPEVGVNMQQCLQKLALLQHPSMRSLLQKFIFTQVFFHDVRGGKQSFTKNSSRSTVCELSSTTPIMVYFLVFLNRPHIRHPGSSSLARFLYPECSLHQSVQPGFALSSIIPDSFPGLSRPCFVINPPTPSSQFIF